MDVTSALNPVSLAVAVLLVAISSLSLVAVGFCLLRLWRRRGASGWVAALASSLLLLGVCSWYASSVRVTLVTAIYSSAYGQPSAPVPPSLVGSWPLVTESSLVVLLAGGLTLVAAPFIALRRSRFAAISKA